MEGTTPPGGEEAQEPAPNRFASEPVEVLLAKGNEALQAGAWSTASDAFLAALDEEETAEALAGLGDALWWLGEIGQAVTYRQQAYARFRRRPDPARAAVIAMRLCIDHRANFGNPAASGGWLAAPRAWSTSSASSRSGGGLC